MNLQDEVWATIHNAVADLTKNPRRRAEVKQPIEYRKRPVVIEAMQLVGNNAQLHAVYQWIESETQGSFDPLSAEVPASGVSIDPATGFLLIATLEGVMQAKPGDYIIRGVQGEFYPCKPDIFEATYEPAGDPDA